MYCANCGNALTEGALFCRRCGQAVGSWSTGTAAASPQSTSYSSEPLSAVPLGAYSPPPTSSIPATAFLPYAGFWLRLVAYLIDKAILSIAFGVIVVIVVGTVGLDRIDGVERESLFNRHNPII